MKTELMALALAFLAVVAVFAALLYRSRILRERQAAELARKMTELEIRALRAQINPHFLFNSLNTAQELIFGEDPESAHRHLSKFARLMRAILERSSRAYCTVAEELETLGLYLDLESARFSHRMSFHLEPDPGLAVHNIEIPTLVIQPFVENAIRHGLLHKSGPGNVWVRMRREGEVLFCTVEDDGVGRYRASEIKRREERRDASHGIRLTLDRLRALFPDEKGDLVKIEDRFDARGDTEGTRVEIRIPIDSPVGRESGH